MAISRRRLLTMPPGLHAFALRGREGLSEMAALTQWSGAVIARPKTGFAGAGPAMCRDGGYGVSPST